MILKENKVMVALIKNVFDEKYAELLAEIVSVFSHSSAIISKNPEKIETLFSEIAKAEGRYNDIIGDMFELLVGYYYQHIGYRYLEIRSIVVFVAKQEGIGVETFSLSRVRRYYETGVKSLLGEALIEYGFPTDAIRRIEENHKKIKSMTVSEAKEYCRLHFREVQLLLDTYERSLFIKAMRTF